MCSRTVLGLVAISAALTLVVPDPAPAAQVCGCKRTTNGRVRRITSGNPLVCPTSQLLVCWNEDPPPGDISARVLNSVEITLASDANGAELTYDTEDFDDGDLHSASAPECLTAAVAGKYLVYAHVQWQGNPNGLRHLAIRNKTAATPLVETGQDASVVSELQQAISTHAKLAAGDCVHVVAAQTSGGSLNLRTINASLRFGMVKLP